MNEVCTVIEFLFYFIFFKILYSLILGCIPGYSGINCTSLCPYPQYGVYCQRKCNCSKDMCDVSTGCFTTGYNVLNSTAKAKAQPLQLIQFTYSSMYVASFIEYDYWFL